MAAALRLQVALHLPPFAGQGDDRLGQGADAGLGVFQSRLQDGLLLGQGLQLAGAGEGPLEGVGAPLQAHPARSQPQAVGGDDRLAGGEARAHGPGRLPIGGGVDAFEPGQEGHRGGDVGGEATLAPYPGGIGQEGEVEAVGRRQCVHVGVGVVYQAPLEQAADDHFHGAFPARVHLQTLTQGGRPIQAAFAEPVAGPVEGLQGLFLEGLEGLAPPVQALPILAQGIQPGAGLLQGRLAVGEVGIECLETGRGFRFQSTALGQLRLQSLPLGLPGGDVVLLQGPFDGLGPLGEFFQAPLQVFDAGAGHFGAAARLVGALQVRVPTRSPLGEGRLRRLQGLTRLRLPFAQDLHSGDESLQLLLQALQLGLVPLAGGLGLAPTRLQAVPFFLQGGQALTRMAQGLFPGRQLRPALVVAGLNSVEAGLGRLPLGTQGLHRLLQLALAGTGRLQGGVGRLFFPPQRLQTLAQSAPVQGQALALQAALLGAQGLESLGGTRLSRQFFQLPLNFFLYVLEAG